ncbi:MAG: EAL domain-containing protein [Clostridiaceae bacterium]|jgi:diguanylate cyclase (GGDEF)-like protein/PAS domain S-box-containing protein|nr:EAL domain-containing protein [Clostridiaceae bacterium]
MGFMVLVYLLTGIFYLYIGVSSLMYDIKNTLNRVFFALCVDLALWAMMLMLMNAASDPETATIFRTTATLFWSLMFCLLLHFLLVLVKKDKFLGKPWSLVVFYLPAVLSIYLYYFNNSNSQENIVRIVGGWAYVNKMGNSFVWDYYLPIYCCAYTLFCVWIILKWGRQTSLKREKKQAGIIVGTIIAVFFLGSLTDLILPALGIPMFPALTVSFIVIPVYGVWYSIKRFRLMNLNPQNVVADVLKTMHEGMVITDRNHRIRDINEGTKMMLGFSKEELVGKTFDALILEGIGCTENSRNSKKEVSLRQKNGESLRVLLSSSTLLDEWDEPYGSVFIFQDLTEIKKIQNELEASRAELEQKVTERTRELRSEIESRTIMENEIRKLAYYDHLTGLLNKKKFIDYVNKIIQNQKGEYPMAVLYLDLDSFKMINDTMGHAKGDKLLKLVSDRLVSTMRMSDPIARVAGDEFLVLAQGHTGEESVSSIASRLNEAFCTHFDLDGQEVYVTVSIGVAVYPVDGDDAETLIKNADIAMYKAKEKGKNKYELCNLAMKTTLLMNMQLTNNLYKAVQRNEFELNYQPQVDINTGTITGFEALIRWNHPERGVIMPSQFIPVAEKTGLILQIGEWVLGTACRQMKQWHDQGLGPVKLSVNLSARQFVDYDLVGLVTRTLLETGLAPCFLELELTESILMDDSNGISEILKQLDKMGVRISIDDFGMKYSSLAYLKKLPIHRLKIDMSFVQGITINQKDEIIINGIIALAKDLGIDVIAEGVETLPQMEFLRNANCFFVQGFYLYRPMTAEKITRKLVN